MKRRKRKTMRAKQKKKKTPKLSLDKKSFLQTSTSPSLPSAFLSLLTTTTTTTGNMTLVDIPINNCFRSGINLM